MSDATDRTRDGNPLPGRFTIPEFTRSLRGFASVGAVGRREHELVFGPLIAARRSAARVLSPEARAAAFDADRLRRALRHAIATIARERSGGQAALERSLEARIEERALPAFAALDALALAAAALRAAPAGAQADRWPAWCDAVQAVFNTVDDTWLALDEVAPTPGDGTRMLLALLLAGATILGAGALPAQRVTLRVEGRADSLLAAGFDVVGAERGATLVVAGSRDRARLDALGLRAAEVPRARAGLRADAQTLTTVYRSFDNPARGIRVWVDSLVRANPRVSVDTIGRSFENRPMLMLKVGPRGDSPQRPNALFMAAYHAREWAATEMVIRLAQWLAAPPGTDARRDSLVQGRDIYILPVANPDGYEYTFTTERLWRKTRSPQTGGAIGTDMNRNHSVNWGLDSQGSSPAAQSEIYRGPQPASEVEVRNVEAFHALHPPAVAISYHTYAGLLIHPPGAVYGALPADAPVYRAVSGTNIASAVQDHLPGSIRTQYAPGPAWLLYTANGEYTDFASTRHGTLAWTAEITSGYGPPGYYGFEFPDDDVLLERLFQDNLPFALDLLDAAADPMAFRSATTGLRADRITIESASPDIRVTVPAASAGSAGIAASGAVTFRIDSANGGRYTRRLVSQPAGRPASFSVTTAAGTAAYRLLAIGGAEAGDAAWAAEGFRRDSIIWRAGTFSWIGTVGSLTTTPMVVPQDADTVSLVYWTMHFGSGFTPEPSGRVELTADNGTTWTPVLVQRGSAPAWYTDRATVGGVRGKSLRFRFVANGMPWRLDEVAVIAHGPVNTSTVAGTAAIRPSENPVRSGSVRLAWPFGAATGEFAAFDFTGREVWRRSVTDGQAQTWDLRATGLANGVYVVVARAGARVSRLKLFVARSGP